MEILIVSATTLEIAPLMREKTTFNYLITGVGVPACLYALMDAFQHTRYDLVIQAGIGGSFNHNQPLGTVYGIEKEAFADCGVYAKGQMLSLFDAGLAEANLPPYTNGWLINENDAWSNLGLPLATGITVNTISDSIENNNRNQQMYNPLVESMEGAAFHYVCLQKKISFLQLRATSNYVGDRNKNNWRIQESVQHLNETVTRIVERIK
jgi:futalosine hydrolase